MKLWDKGQAPDKLIEDFTVGKDRDLDMLLAHHDVIGSAAHIKMLNSIQLLSDKELQKLLVELEKLHNLIINHNFSIEEGVEDIHSQVELMLTQKLGETGKKIHSGRSRNDQVLLDIKLFIREQIQLITGDVNELFKTLIQLSNTYKDVLIPGYTHLQVAMPSSFGLWFGAYAESLSDDIITLKAAWDIANQNPLGSAAGYGSSFPLNRTMTTELLAFKDLTYNVVYAQMGRGKTERITASAMANIAATLAKMAMDACLYNSQNFGFLTFPDKYTTGSSIMPHKKNPDVFELIRAKCNKIQALPNELSMIITNLPSGYHRDLQILKESIFPAFTDLRDCLQISKFMLEHVIINDSSISDEKYKYVFSVEEVNNRVLKGTPFRDAYKQVGQEINNGDFAPDFNIQHTHEGSIGNLCNDKIELKMDKMVQSFQFEKVNVKLGKIFSTD